MNTTSSPLPLTARQDAQLDEYLKLLLHANDRFNLTAIVAPDEARQRHIVESLRLVPALDSVLPATQSETAMASRRHVLDLGSGGGLPGMVLAIARPDLNFILLEATEKKAMFLRETALQLELKHVSVECNRAELAAAPGSKWRESMDMVTARAVAPLPTLLELAVPFLKVDGVLLAVKGERANEELEQAKRALSLLYTECVRTERQPSATLLLLKKTKKTPALYPRRSGEPKKKPL